MSLFYSSLIISLLIFSISCKTREDIAREQMVDQMSLQMQDGQKLTADFSVRIQNIEDKINNLAGSLEENQHTTQKTLNERMGLVEEKMKLIEEGQKQQSEKLDTITKEFNSQKKYIKDVLGTLKSISKRGGSSSKKSRRNLKKKESAYQRAMSLYRSHKYKGAKKELLFLLNNGKLNQSQKARVIHNLGMIAYMDKENEKALAYFSRLFSEFPKVGYNRNGLMFLAKTLKRIKKNEEAKQALNELINRFPKAKQVLEAKKMLKSL